jgi:hypothetical protein
MSADDLSPWLIRGLYLFGVSLMLTAAIDLFTTVWPMRPGDIGWRYGFLGLGAGYLQTPTLGLALIALTAIWDDDVLMLRIVGVCCLATAVILLGIMGIFGLDVVQMRQLRPEEAQASVMAGGMFQEVKYFVAFVIFAFLGHGSLKTAKVLAHSGGRVARTPGIVSTAGRE